MIPKEWEVQKLGEISVNLDNKRVPLSAKEREKMKGIYPYYGAQGIIDHINDYIFDGIYLLVAEDGENLKSHKEKIATIAKGKFWVNNHAHIIFNNEKNDLKFLYYSINTVRVSKYLTGSVQPKLNQKNLNRILIACPQLQEQKIITNILSSFDDKIDHNNQMNKTLEQIAQTLFKHWFIDFEFPDENGNPYKASGGRMVDSELEEIPEGWKVKQIGDICETFGGGTPKTSEPSYWEDGDVFWATPTDMTSLNSPIIFDTSRKITVKGLQNSSAKLLPVGSILMTSRATLGYFAISKVPISTNQGFISMVCDDTTSKYYLLNSVQNKMDEIENLASGSTFLEINKTSFRSIRIILPPKSVIKKFDEIADLIYEKIFQNELETKRLAEVRDYLLPKLMSGKIRVEC